MQYIALLLSVIALTGSIEKAGDETVIKGGCSDRFPL